MMGDKLALSGTLVRKTGDGIIDFTWTDFSCYYLGSSFQLNENHRFEFAIEFVHKDMDRIYTNRT